MQDQGPGIAPAERERIFERFYQGAAPPDGPIHGTGLGLAICKALIEAHGGSIWVDPHHHPGARICFSLPLALALPESTSADVPFIKALPTGHEVAHVLIVDDEPPMRQMLEGSLRNAGYVVHAVPEGQAALEYLATEQPDLIVLDLMLPGQDGFAVLQQIRDWSDVLVMILTAAPEPYKVVRGLQLGADDYLTKPFSMDEFLARIEALLRRHNNQIALAPSIFQQGPLVIDFTRRSVEVNGQAVELTPIEFRLLAYLAQHPNQVLTHTQILQHVWGPNTATKTNTCGYILAGYARRSSRIRKLHSSSPPNVALAIGWRHDETGAPPMDRVCHMCAGWLRQHQRCDAANTDSGSDANNASNDRARLVR